MKLILGLFFVLGTILQLNAQVGDTIQKDVIKKDTLIRNFDSSQKDAMPVFNYKGMDFSEFIMENTNYPKDLKKKGLEAVITIRFIVEKDGSVSRVVCPDSSSIPMNKRAFMVEALRVVNLSNNKWKPGKRLGVDSVTVLQIPILFELE